jgi:hypothetical protein
VQELGSLSRSYPGLSLRVNSFEYCVIPSRVAVQNKMVCLWEWKESCEFVTCWYIYVNGSEFVSAKVRVLFGYVGLHSSHLVIPISLTISTTVAKSQQPQLLSSASNPDIKTHSFYISYALLHHYLPSHRPRNHHLSKSSSLQLTTPQITKMKLSILATALFAIVALAKKPKEGPSCCIYRVRSKHLFY